MEGALNHIFTHSLPYAAIPSINLEAVVGKEIIVFEFPKELTGFANRYLYANTRKQTHKHTCIVYSYVFANKKFTGSWLGH